MLRHRFLTSLLVWSAHAQLTPQPRFQSETGEATPSPSDSLTPSYSILGRAAVPHRPHSGHGKPSGSPTLHTTGVSAQTSEVLVNKSKRPLSPGGLLRNYGLAQSAAHPFREAQLSHAATSSSRTAEEARGGTPRSTTEGVIPSNVTHELSHHHRLQNPASVVAAVETGNDNSYLHKEADVLHDVEDVDSVTLPSLLREALLSHNPGLSPSHFASHGDADPQEFQGLDQFLPQAREESSSSGGGPEAREADRESSGQEHGQPTKQGGEEEHRAISVEPRSWRCSIPDVLVGNDELPWTCRQHFAWRHLGEHVYPSRLYESVCEGRTCWYGHFNCTPITYTLHVLQVCLHGCHDQRVPFPLRSRWQWTDLNVTVGCQCVR